MQYCDLNQSKFENAKVTQKIQKLVINNDYRVCLDTNDFDRFKAIFEEEINLKFQKIYNLLQVQPFKIANIETQIVAHGDGAFFK